MNILAPFLHQSGSGGPGASRELEWFNGTANFFAFDIYTATYYSEPAGVLNGFVRDSSHANWLECTVTSTGSSTWEAIFYGNVDRVALRANHTRTILGYWNYTYPTVGGITIAKLGLRIYRATNMSLEHHVNDLS